MISFYNEGIEFDREDFQEIKDWIAKVIKEEKYNLKKINYIFSNDRYLLDINKKYLRHNYYTDIITFPYSKDKYLEADIFISIERVQENANKYKVEFINEFLRVLIHGILHITGHNDSNKEEIEQMRKKEDYYLNKY